MAHVRQQIRDRVATLVTGLGTGATVYKMRKYSLDDAKLPALIVYTTSESSDLITIGTRTLRRRLDVVVEALALGSSATIFETIDTMCVEVEEALAADFELNGLAKSTVLRSTETDVNVEGDRGVGVGTMTFQVEYVTSIGDVETAR